MTKKSKLTSPMAKRMLSSMFLWLFFGFVCAYLAFLSIDVSNFWWSSLMRSIVFNRFIIGFAVAIIWVFLVHPVLKVKLNPIFRWSCVGFLVSLNMAFVARYIIWENTMMFFIATVVSGMIYGAVIDLIVTKLTGQWEMLLEWTQK